MVKSFLQGAYGSITQVDPHLASALYGWDRWQSKEKMLKWLKQKKMVVLNRYTTSNLIHQAVKLPPKARGAFVRWLETMEYDILKLPKPNLILYLHLPARLALNLIAKR